MRKKLITFTGSAALLLMHAWSQAATDLPPSAKVDLGPVEEVCSQFTDPAWRKEQVIDGVKIQESKLCNPDNPADIAAFVKGTNGVSMDTLMATQLAADAITMSDDIDGDGDPDKIIIKLEVVELNGHSPDMKDPTTTFDISPGIQPTFWVYAPKTRDMSTKSLYELEANPLLRAPSPVIRVEQDDVVWIVLENTHYLPHSIHLHGIDHPFMDHSQAGNDGVVIPAQFVAASDFSGGVAAVGNMSSPSYIDKTCKVIWQETQRSPAGFSGPLVPHRPLAFDQGRAFSRCCSYASTKEKEVGKGVGVLYLIQVGPPLPHEAPSQAGLYSWEASLQTPRAHVLPAFGAISLAHHFFPYKGASARTVPRPAAAAMIKPHISVPLLSAAQPAIIGETIRPIPRYTVQSPIMAPDDSFEKKSPAQAAYMDQHAPYPAPNMRLATNKSQLRPKAIPKQPTVIRSDASIIILIRPNLSESAPRVSLPTRPAAPITVIRRVAVS